MARTHLTEYIQNDLDKQKGISIPVRAGLPERLLVRSVSCKNLHANADDEFAAESVGPSERIIGEYVAKFSDAIKLNIYPFDEPLTVEKLRPHGYLILNGHHRWVAAMRCGIKKVPVRIINCATESDIKTLLENSKHDKRAAIDLDEVVFGSSDYPYIEKKAFMFPLSLRFKQRVRLGIPALFYYLVKHGYDIWVYAADYYSIDDIQKFFKAYSVHVDGIITGIEKHRQNMNEKSLKMKELIANKYRLTLHIDNNSVLETNRDTDSFEEHAIDSSGEDWSKNTIAIIEEIEKRAGKK